MAYELQFSIELENSEQPIQKWDTAKPMSFEANEDSFNQNMKVRLDKWLWATRFFKTRALARAAVENGKVMYNGEIVRASKEISLGDKVQINQGRIIKEITIIGMSTRRRNAEDSLSLYRETNQQPLANFENSYTNRRPRRTSYAATPFVPNAALPFAPPTSTKTVEVRTGGSLRYLRKATKSIANRIYATNEDY